MKQFYILSSALAFLTSAVLVHAAQQGATWSVPTVTNFIVQG
jgi:hypothetical protein